MTYYFTSDLHLGDPRLNLYGRDLIAKNSNDIDELIINNWNNTVSKNDVTYLLGDICYDKSKLDLINKLNGRKILIKGNYDDPISDDTWLKYVETVEKSKYIRINGTRVFLNHYPTNCDATCFNICGHIHGTWKVQRNMINVGMDAWHFFPVSLDRIKFQMNGIKNHYDDNVFIGDNVINKETRI